MSSPTEIHERKVYKVRKNQSFVLPFRNIRLSNIDRMPSNGRLEETIIDGELKLVYTPARDSFEIDIVAFVRPEEENTNSKTEIILQVEETVFRPKARLLIQLGDQLIRNEAIALLELVKNSYDADSSKVDLYLEKVDQKGNGVIIIEDDGFGMNKKIIETVWLEPGNNHKRKLIENNELTPIFGRLPIGEKGIGRFGVHKLGKTIELISKRKGSKEVTFKIDWEVFEKVDYLSDIPIEIVETDDPVLFKGGKTGTSITISNLRTSWSRGMVRQAYRTLQSLVPPFQANEQFKIDIHLDKEDWIKDLETWDDFKNQSLFKFDLKIQGNMITDFKYEFTPWSNMKGLKKREKTQEDIEVRKTLRMIDKEKKAIDLSLYKIGAVRFEGYIFDLDRRVMKLGLISSKSLGEYLNSNGGVRVFRNGMRIYDYGEPGNDWLELDRARINEPTQRLSNKILVAGIFLDRVASDSLIEKANREGFVENDAYEAFWKAIRYALNRVAIYRNEDKEKIRTLFSPTVKSEPVLKSIEDLRSLVFEKVIEKPLRKEIGRYIDKIEKDYKSINEILLSSAGAGMSLSVVIHEIEKVIKELAILVSKESSEKTVQLVKQLERIVNSYGDIIRHSRRKDEDLGKIVKQALFYSEYRLNNHGVKVSLAFDDHYTKLPTVKVSRNLLLGALTNIIDNSIYWLDYSNNTDKEIFIDFISDEPDYYTLIIADNGTGFFIPTDNVIKPFVSGKNGGLGLGLHITSEIMEAQGGYLSFPEFYDYIIPDKFKNGAILGLNFKK